MKRWLSVGILASFALLLVACEPQVSLFPLYTDTDTLFDKQLLGEWQIWGGTELQSGEKPGTIVFSESSDAYTYDVKIPNFDEEKKIALCTQTRLVPLGKYVFIDFGSPDMGSRSQAPYPIIEAHVFGVLTVQGDKARIDLLSDDWVENTIKAGKMPLAFADTRQTDKMTSKIVLSADTSDLRKFALEHAEDHDAFAEVFTLVRNK